LNPPISNLLDFCVYKFTTGLLNQTWISEGIFHRRTSTYALVTLRRGYVPRNALPSFSLARERGGGYSNIPDIFRGQERKEEKLGDIFWYSITGPFRLPHLKST